MFVLLRFGRAKPGSRSERSGMGDFGLSGSDIFDSNKVMREDVTSTDASEHMNAWRVAYDPDTVREWLSEQTI